MKKITKLILIALLISTVVLAQKGTPPGTQIAPSQTKVIVMGAFSNNIILLSPTGGKLIGTTDASKPVLFRWTAVSPKPKEDVTYRLRVWQLMEGQNSTEAMRTNQPLVTKEVTNITQTAIGNLYTGPCKPPSMCDFVWAVEAFTGDDMAAGKPYGASEHFSFKFNADNSKSTPTVKSTDGQSDPVHGVDIKLRVKASKEAQATTYALYLPVEKTVYDASGNITGIMIKTEKGELDFVKVVVAGSHSLSGGYCILRTEKGEPVIAKVVVAGSNSLSPGVK